MSIEASTPWRPNLLSLTFIAVRRVDVFLPHLAGWNGVTGVIPGIIFKECLHALSKVSVG